jgi:hypothetical protein
MILLLFRLLENFLYILGDLKAIGFSEYLFELLDHWEHIQLFFARIRNTKQRSVLQAALPACGIISFSFSPTKSATFQF